MPRREVETLGLAKFEVLGERKVGHGERLIAHVVERGGNIAHTEPGQCHQARRIDR